MDTRQGEVIDETAILSSTNGSREEEEEVSNVPPHTGTDIHGASTQVPGLDRFKLNRILRMVAGVGLLKELAGPDGKALYRLTPGTALMQTGLPQPSLACGVHTFSEKPMWDAALHLTDAVTGVLKGHPDAAVLGAGKSIWDHYESEPASLANFAEFMSVFSFPEVRSLHSLSAAHNLAPPGGCLAGVLTRPAGCAKTRHVLGDATSRRW